MSAQAIFVLILTVTLAAAGQVTSAPPPKTQPEKKQIPEVLVHFDSAHKVSTLGGMNGIETPQQCGEDGSIFFRMEDINTIYRISHDGATTTYSILSINDLPNPFATRLFPTDQGVYVLIRSLSEISKIHRGQANISVHKIDETRRLMIPQYHIARFDLSGNYRGSEKLEVPFDALQIGAFPSGDFLVSGTDPETGEPRLAIVNGRGQYVRAVELQDDINAESESVVKHSWVPGNPREAMRWMISLSDLVSHGNNLLLVRKQSDPTVYEINSSGQVRRVKISGILKAGTLNSLKSAGHYWVLQFGKKLPDEMGGMAITDYIVDPHDGRVLQKLVYDESLPFGADCFSDGRIYAFQVQNDSVILKSGELPAVASAPAEE